VKHDDLIILFIRELEGKATTEELLQIEQLVASDPDTRQLYEDIKDTFADPESRAHFLQRDEEALLQELHTNVDRKKRFRSWAVAASVFVPLIALAGYLLIHNSGSKLMAHKENPGISLKLADGRTLGAAEIAHFRSSSARLDAGDSGISVTTTGSDSSGALNTLTVPRKFIYKIQLSDGTKVQLNAETNFRFPFNFKAGSREVFLEGEAFFEVAPDPARPFIVHTSKAVITVLGTSFNINSYGGGLTTSLVTGSVSLSDGRHHVVLNPGQAASPDSSTRGFLVKPFDEEVVLGWTQGSYYYEFEQLSEIMKVVGRWYDQPYVFDDPGLARVTFKGVVHKEEPIARLLTNLQNTNRVSYHYDEDSVLHLSDALK